MLTVILNPSSGTSSAIDVPRLVELFHAGGVDVNIVRLTLDRADAMIREAAASADGVIVAAGGDGTLNSVAAVLAGGSTALGILPFGTLNHFAKDLHIPMDTAQAVDTILARHIERVDVGYVNERVFINNSSIGVYPDVVEAREQLRRQGHRKWAAMAMATVKVLERDTEVVARIEVEGRSVVTRTPFLFVGNNKYTLEGIHLGERSGINGGLLYAYLAPRWRTHDLPKLFLLALLGRARRHGTFATFAGAELWIETPRTRTMQVATDGEIATLETPLHYRVAPGALKVIVPAG